MLVNNFQLIEEYMDSHPCNEGEFHFLQIIQRNKENPDLGSNNHVIREYMVENSKYLEKYKNEIITLCEMFNARAYIHISKKTYKDVGFQVLNTLAEYLSQENYHGVKHLYSTSVGRCKSSDKTFLVDIDTREKGFVDECIKCINYDCSPLDNTNKVILTVPTLHGFHIITKPFDVYRFREIYFNIDIHKNNPTLLYYKENKNMTYLINIEEPEEGLNKTETIKATCIEDAETIIKAQFPSWHIADIKEENMFDDNGYSKMDDHNPYPEE